MKKLIYFIVLTLPLFQACQNSSGREKKDKDDKENSKKNITKRDLSISGGNAFNDLFLDSTGVENYLAENKVPDSLSRRIRSFYNSRNYQFAWFSSDGLTEQARGFWNLHSYEIKYGGDTTLDDKKLRRRMDNLITEESISPKASDKNIINTELVLTHHFIHYTLSNYEKGYIKRKEMERFIPAKKLDAVYLADSLLTKKHKDDKYYEDINESYRLLKQQLAKYYTITKNGGWPIISLDKKKYKPGDSSIAIQLMKKRLAISGDLAETDTTNIFTDTLMNGIKKFQSRHGFTADGKISPALVKEMNVTARQRLEQLLLNMERMRWMPTRPEGNMILVNIPEFMLHVYEGRNKAFDMVVVVGKEGHNTMMFRGDLNQVVFSPYWNVPQSIVTKEILPAIEKNSKYLAKENMEVTGTDADGVPEIRQLPGAKNSLGRVKFLFPNSFNIYFHDTPAKSLFSKDKRAYSHGCIRLSDPEKMANYLLRNDPNWTETKIEEAMNSGKERFVKLKDPIPVFITYYTAWVDESGALNFREDIYGHDSSVSAKMFRGA